MRQTLTSGTQELERKLAKKEGAVLARGQLEIGLSLALGVEMKGITEAFRPSDDIVQEYLKLLRG